MSKQKAKGTAAESAVVNYLRTWFPKVERRALQGTNDKGDINLGIDFPVVIEVKDQQRMVLSEYVDEATAEAANANTWLGVAWHKRPRKGKPQDWYVSMRGEVFVQLLLGYLDGVDLEEHTRHLCDLILEGDNGGRS